MDTLELGQEYLLRPVMNTHHAVNSRLYRVYLLLLRLHEPELK
jgi:hypothetical protein